MKKALREGASLPYPQLIIIFMQHFVIPLDDEPFVQLERSFRIEDEVICSFKFIKNDDGQWVHKRGDASTIPRQCQPPPPPPQQDTSSIMLTKIMNEIRDLRAFVCDNFNRIDV